MENQLIDQIIASTIILFVLSMISERIVTFFKLWCTEGKRFLLIIVPATIDTSTPSDDPALETKRTRAILAINLTISFLVALIAKASIFDLFNFTTTDAARAASTDASVLVSTILGWEPNDVTPTRISSIVIGCAFTGSFISLGSKFWHDLLDLLLQVKDLKEKMVDRETYEIKNVKELDEFLEKEYYQLAKLCVEQNKTKLDTLADVEDYFIGRSSDPGRRKPVIILYSSLASGGGYPKSFKATLDSGKQYSIGVETVYGFQIPEIQLDSGDSIFNSATELFTGTMCCNVVRNDGTYILTCAHVLTAGGVKIELANKNGWITTLEENTLSIENGTDPIGSWAFGVIDGEFDVALVKSDLTVDSVIEVKNPPPEYDHELNGKEVFVKGNKTQSKAAVFGFTEKDIKFKYGNKSATLKNLMMLSRSVISAPKSVTQKGDSGALVYLTKDKTALGMVVGGNDQFTYIIPMSSILRLTQSRLA